MNTPGKKVPAAFQIYEAGKQRRYALLFSVNGACFAVAKLVVGPNPALVLGGLTLRNLAVGAIVFTILMAVDVFFFGQHMRATIPDAQGGTRSDYIDVFGWIGKAVLAAIAMLLCTGWALVAAYEVSTN